MPDPADLPEARPSGARSRRSDAEANSRRIVAAARELLARDPEASIDDIAAAAGLTRRTVYGHFRNRAQLLEALGREVSSDVSRALSRAADVTAGPAQHLAAFLFSAWQVGDDYRVLLTISRQTLGEAGCGACSSP